MRIHHRTKTKQSIALLKRSNVKGIRLTRMRNQSTSDFLLFAPAIFFLGMGCLGLFLPQFISSLFDVKLDSVNGRNEVRAVYGGFGIALTLAIFFAIKQPHLRRGISFCLSLSMFGMAFGRLVSSCIEQPGAICWVFVVVECLLATAIAYGGHVL